jgi:hsp70-interacting protein
MNGAEIIASYLEHKRPSMVQCSCELIAAATQNNPKTQEAFLATLPRLLTILNGRSFPASVAVKALYAVSCLTRGYDAGVIRLLSLDGMATLHLCLAAEDPKLVVKTLFMMMSFYSTAQGEVKELLVAQLSTLVPELVNLVKSGRNEEVKGHALSALVTMVTHHPEAVQECRKEGLGLKNVLSQLTGSLSPEDQEEELAAVNAIMTICFPS